ncbi:MAG: hypothetical protein LQ343_005885 [Gyalolechia ehrenbergii]|nr:MAG: hypothetical protein LQ343_005885 [Gyalolechia ehrenbergii]
MASPATPQSTNARISQSATATPSPGRWRHPGFDEITRRQKASTFDDSNVQRITYNTGFIIVLLLLRRFLQSSPETIPVVISPVTQSYLHNTLLFSIFLPFFNIAIALYPLYKGQDNVPDIPLTPSQRALLGLDPNATPPPAQGAQYITPPRYPRSTTPRNSSPASNRSNRSSAGSTPFSRKERSSESSSFGRSESDSPFSSSASPLWHKGALGSGRDSRRHSLGLPSPLGPGKNDSRWCLPSTPSPVMGKGQGASVRLNNRWLYQRQRTGSGRVAA